MLKFCLSMIPIESIGRKLVRYLYYITLFIIVIFSLQCNSSPESIPEKSAKPFFTAREQQTGYSDLYSEEPDPNHLTEIRLGYFGPTDPNHSAGLMWQAATMAVEQANQTGGYRGIPFRLLPVWSENPWGTGVSHLFRLVYEQPIWAIIGGIDGPTTHLAEQVVAKARLPLISPACSDKTVNLANVPWMFSCLPGDHLSAPPLAAAIAEQCANKTVILLSAIDHDSHLFTVELQKNLTNHNISPQHHIEFDPAAVNINTLVQRVLRLNPQALIVIADAAATARIISTLPEHVHRIPIFGGPALGQILFMESAGSTAEGIIFPVFYLPDQTSPSFDTVFQARWQTHPDYRSAYTYDAVNLLIAAIRKTGLNRARIGNALRELTGYEGVTGPFHWDPLNSNTRPVSLGMIKNGSIIPLATPVAPADTPAR
jgi:branched-chain amino acid transport system substrate-binding protein